MSTALNDAAGPSAFWNYDPITDSQSSIWLSPSASSISQPYSTPSSSVTACSCDTSYIPLANNVCCSTPSSESLESCDFSLDNVCSVGDLCDTKLMTCFASLAETKSKLIKEGLKVTIQCKRQARGLDAIPPDSAIDQTRNVNEQLSEEDLERRRRRRERNKIAASRCRKRKKERVNRLLVEQQVLEAHIFALKKDLINLENEQRQLLRIVNTHQPCYLTTY